MYSIGKRVEGDDKHKGLAIETFGMSMSAQSYTLREGSAYRTALQRMGDAHQNIGAAQSDMISRFGGSYLECLEKGQAQMKEYQVKIDVCVCRLQLASQNTSSNCLSS